MLFARLLHQRLYDYALVILAIPVTNCIVVMSLLCPSTSVFRMDIQLHEQEKNFRRKEYCAFWLCVRFHCRSLDTTSSYPLSDIKGTTPALVFNTNEIIVHVFFYLIDTLCSFGVVVGAKHNKTIKVPSV